MSDNSDQEIDLRPYIEAVLSKWYWIVGLGLLAGLLVYGAISLLVAPTYQATALVSITEPRQRVQFDPRIVSVEENQPLRAYPEIAVSDDLLATLQEQVPEARSFTLQQLRALLKASPGNDPSLLKLSARNREPQTAAAIANGWAELFVAWANTTYGDSSEEQLIFFEQRLQYAEEELGRANTELIQYQAKNRSVILENKLEALKQAHADLLAKQGEIDLILQDIDSLQALDTSGSSVSTSDQFTSLILRLRAYGGPPNNEFETFPWQLQVGTDAIATFDQEDLQKQIGDLQDSLAIQAERVAASLSEIEPQILVVQQEKQEANALEALLLRNIEVAEDAHTALALTVEEKRITSQDTNTGVNLVSRSAAPTAPVGPRKTVNALAAAIAVVLFSILFIVVYTWWRSDQRASRPHSVAEGNEDERLAGSGNRA
jgi:capsular polysaccharide biosynthesis protein